MIPSGNQTGLAGKFPIYIVWWSLMIFPAIKLHVQMMFPLRLPVWWENPCFPADFRAFLEAFLAMFDCQRVESLRPFSMLSQADLSRAWTGCWLGCFTDLTAMAGRWHTSIWVWVNTYRYIFCGMNIHLPVILGSLHYQGFDSYPYHLYFCVWICVTIHVHTLLLEWG